VVRSGDGYPLIMGRSQDRNLSPALWSLRPFFYYCQTFVLPLLHTSVARSYSPYFPTLLRVTYNPHLSPIHFFYTLFV